MQAAVFHRFEAEDQGLNLTMGRPEIQPAATARQTTDRFRRSSGTT